MCKSICDIHSHILPGVDDGAKTMEETMETLQEALRQNVRKIIVTPHFHPGRYVADGRQVRETLCRVQEECRKRRINVELYPGQECYYYSGLAEQLKRGNALTMAGSSCVLVEFEPDTPFSYLQQGVFTLQQNGYQPILAHFERYHCLKNTENVRRLKECGVYLQINFDTLARRDGFFNKNPWRKLVAQGMVDFIGSDCHGMDFRPMQIWQGSQWMEKSVDPQLRRRMLDTNIQKILMNK